MATNRIEELTKQAIGTIALYTTDESALWALYSGGKDSTVVAHLASFLPRFRGVAHVQTLTGPASIRHSQRVIETAKSNGWEVITATPFTTLPMIAINNGLPGPAMHSWAYRFLKERPIRQMAKDARKISKAKRVIWLSGIRRSESAARNEHATERTIASNSEWWVNPILEWSDDDVREYIEAHNLTVANWHHSVDCFCGAYADETERFAIKLEDVDQALYIAHVEEIARLGREIQLLEVKYGARDPKDVTPIEMCTWGHGLNKSRLKKQRENGPTICNKCGVLEEVLQQAAQRKENDAQD